MNIMKSKMEKVKSQEEAAATLSQFSPTAVPLSYHFCFGTHWRFGVNEHLLNVSHPFWAAFVWLRTFHSSHLFFFFKRKNQISKQFPLIFGEHIHHTVTVSNFFWTNFSPQLFGSSISLFRSQKSPCLFCSQKKSQQNVLRWKRKERGERSKKCSAFTATGSRTNLLTKRQRSMSVAGKVDVESSANKKEIFPLSPSKGAGCLEFGH